MSIDVLTAHNIEVDVELGFGLQIATVLHVR